MNTAGASTNRHERGLAVTVTPTRAADPGRYVLFNPSGLPEYHDEFWLVDLFEEKFARFDPSSWEGVKQDVSYANRKQRQVAHGGVYMWNTLDPDELDDHDEEGWLREQFKFGLLKCEREAKSK